MDINKKKERSFFIKSALGVVVVCICLFVWQGIYIGNKTRETIYRVSETYMEEINIQLQQKFKTIIDMRFMQVDGVLTAVPPEKHESREALIQDITERGNLRGFSYMGFVREDYTLEGIYGDDLIIMGNNDIDASLDTDNSMLEYGVDLSGKKYLIFGRRASYDLEDGGKSIALAAAVPMDYMDEVLFLDGNNGSIYTHIINDNGYFIISNGFVTGSNYFSGVRRMTTEEEGNRYIGELKEAIAENTPYMFSYYINDSLHYVYCSPIAENSEWYFITVMPSSMIDKYFNEFNKLRYITLIAVAAILLSVMLGIIVMYYIMSQKQIKELERAREASDAANHAKTEFLSSMSHDIRTPMNAIIGMTDIGFRNIDDPERVKYCFDKIDLSSKHLLAMVNDILDMSKIESGKLSLNVRKSSIKFLADDIVSLSQASIREKSQNFDIFIKDIIAEDVYCDDIRLYQVLVNITSNAFKYTPPEGTIHIFIYQETSPLGDEYIRTHFNVKDNGIGMSKEFLEKIFVKFEREERDSVQAAVGTGLGMAITKRIVDLMGGTIEVISELNVGSEFKLTLDFKKADEAAPKYNLPPWNVLVVDDDRELCETAVLNLDELGLKGEWVTESRKAVKMIKERHENCDDYDFVLLDLRMPEMNGVETIKEIREKVSRTIPIFLISAYDFSEVEDEISLGEFEGFIAKPLFKSRLYEALSKYNSGENITVSEKPKYMFNFSGKRFLVAEDVEINWEIVREALETTGATAELARNGKECVEMLEDSPVGYYDGILMDIRMPVMNGIDATKEIRKCGRPDAGLPIIAMTANAFSGDVQECLDAGMNAHIAKPIDLKTMFTVLRRFIN